MSQQLGGGGYVNLNKGSGASLASMGKSKGMNRGKTGNSVADFVYGTIWPRVYKTAPPNLNTQTSFSKQIDVVGNFVIDDSGLNGSNHEKVPTANGLIVWQPNRGAGSCYRMGIVPQGATSVWGADPTVIKGLEMGRFQSAGWNTPGNCTFTYGTATALPVSITTTNDVLAIGPPLEQSFSQVRVYSGDLRVICDSVPIGLTALNGVFSAGSFSDSTDVSQVASVAGAPGTCFNPTNLVQTSVTTKDGLKEVNAMKGIVSLVGSDIQPFYAVPNADIYDTISGGWTTFTQHVIVPPGRYDTNVQHYASATWFSPWDIQFSDTTAGSNVTNFNVGPINLNGCLDFRCNAGLPQLNAAIHGTSGGSAADVADMCYFMTYTHVWAAVTTGTASFAHSVIYKTDIETFQFSLGSGLVGADGDLVTFESETTPRMYQQTFNGLAIDAGGLVSGAGGMYIGTLCTLLLINIGTAVSADPTIVADNGFLNFQVRARNYYGQGELGPMRVIRWDAMSNQQLITVNGKINCQCIPEGTIAPFIQPQAMYMPGASNLNAMPFLAELYNGNTEVRRNWDGPSYDAFTRKYAMIMKNNPEMVVEWGPENPKLMATAHAAGIFDALPGIGGLLGGAMGARFGPAGAALGEQLGSMGGDLLGNVFSQKKASSGGQFGSQKRRSLSRRSFGSGAPFGAHAPFGAGGQFGAPRHHKKRGRSASKASSQKSKTLSARNLNALQKVLGSSRSFSAASSKKKKHHHKKKSSHGSKSGKSKHSYKHKGTKKGTSSHSTQTKRSGKKIKRVTSKSKKRPSRSKKGSKAGTRSVSTMTKTSSGKGSRTSRASLRKLKRMVVATEEKPWYKGSLPRKSRAKSHSSKSSKSSKAKSRISKMSRDSKGRLLPMKKGTLYAGGKPQASAASRGFSRSRLSSMLRKR